MSNRLSFDAYVQRTGRLSLAIGACLLLAASGCDPLATADKAPDVGKKQEEPPPPPPPDPYAELEKKLREVEREMGSASPDQLMKLDAAIYDAMRGRDPKHTVVQRAGKLRGEIKKLLVPAYMRLAEQSFEAGRYDAAARQAQRVPDSAGKELVARKKALLKKMPGVLKKRASCASKHGMKPCLLREQHPDWSMKICKALTEEMVGLEMTPEMIRTSWGEPLDVERTEEEGKLRVVWHYAKGASVIFEGKDANDLKAVEVGN